MQNKMRPHFKTIPLTEIRQLDGTSAGKGWVKVKCDGFTLGNTTQSSE